LTNSQDGSIRNSNEGVYGSFAGTIILYGGNITNNGTIYNIFGLIKVNSGSITTSGKILNVGGYITKLSGTITILPGGIITNIDQNIVSSGLSLKSASITQNNIATIINSGNLTNSGTLYNGAGANIINNSNGTIINNPSSTVTNFGIITNNSTGTLTNSGTIGNVCGGTVIGKLSGNAAIPQPCPRTTITTVTPNPSSVVVGGNITYTATVVDSNNGIKSTPTGSVLWDDMNETGTFGSSWLCTLSSGSCQVSYSPPINGSVTITATYLSDSVHGTSSGTTTLTVIPSCSLPVSGDWIITSNCILNSTSTAPGNIIVQSGKVLTIPSGLKLTIDFKHYHLLVKSGGGVLIKAGGAIN
jgi:hypothetical protein